MAENAYWLAALGLILAVGFCGYLAPPDKATAQSECPGGQPLTKEYLDHRLGELERRLVGRLTLLFSVIVAAAVAIAKIIS